MKNSWKCWCFVKIEFLDKNSTFRIVFFSVENVVLWMIYHLKRVAKWRLDTGNKLLKNLGRKKTREKSFTRDDDLWILFMEKREVVMKMLNADHFWRFFDDFSSKVPESGFLCETPAILHLARLINWQNASDTFFANLLYYVFQQVLDTHCSKSSFFVQKFNFDFPRKLLIFLGEKLVKMLWFWTF